MSVADEEPPCLCQVCVYIEYVQVRRKSKNPNTFSTQHILLSLEKPVGPGEISCQPLNRIVFVRSVLLAYSPPHQHTVRVHRSG